MFEDVEYGFDFDPDPWVDQLNGRVSRKEAYHLHKRGEERKIVNTKRLITRGEDTRRRTLSTRAKSEAMKKPVSLGKGFA